MTVLQMGEDEVRRLKVLVEFGDDRLRSVDATVLLGVGRGQLLRFRGRFAAEGRTA